MPSRSRSRSRQVRGVSGSAPLTGVNRPPFAAGSFWNKTLADLYGSSIPVHPDNDLLIESVRRSINFTSAGVVGPIVTGDGARHFRFTTSTSQFTPAVWVVKPGWTYQNWQLQTGSYGYTPRLCESSDSSTTITTANNQILQIPMPPQASVDAGLIRSTPPAYAVDSGTDSQMVIWDRDNLMNHPNGSQWWDLWQCRSNISNILTRTGGFYVASNCSHFVGEAASLGVPANTPAQYASRGGGTPYMAGHVFAWELEQAAASEGKINHALACAFSSPYHQYVSPASKSDGGGLGISDAGAGNPYSPPEGALLVLRDDFNIGVLSDARSRALARTMRYHGMRIIDNSGRPKIYLDADVAANDGAGWTTPMNDNIIGEIPLDALYVVDWSGGSSGRSTGASGWGTGSQQFKAGLTGGIAGVPAVIDSVIGGPVAAASVASTSFTPGADELLMAIWTQGDQEGTCLMDCAGNGMVLGWQANQWREYTYSGIYNTGNRNCVGGVVVARAPSGGGSAGSLTLTTSRATSKSLVVLRLTANSVPIRSTRNSCGDTRSATPTCTIQAPGNGNLLIGIVEAYRGNINNNPGTGWTQVRNIPNGGNGAHLAVFTKISDGSDATLAPTLTASSEWQTKIIEVT